MSNSFACSICACGVGSGPSSGADAISGCICDAQGSRGCLCLVSAGNFQPRGSQKSCLGRISPSTDDSPPRSLPWTFPIEAHADVLPPNIPPPICCRPINKIELFPMTFSSSSSNYHKLFFHRIFTKPFPSIFDPAGGGVHIIRNVCSSLNSLSYSAGPAYFSFMAEFVALEHGLNWRLRNLFTGQFQLICF